MVLSSGMGGKSEDGENWMADRIRKRRGVLDGDGAGNNFDEAQTVEDLMASETDFDDPVSGPHFPNYRLSKRTISGASYRTDEDTDYSEYEALIKSKIIFYLILLSIFFQSPVDSSLNWFQRTRQALHGDFSSICLLLFLYLLQGVPLGLIAAIPLVLSSRNASYGQQAVFSFAYWPFSLKLLWAPIVDSVYWKRMGRRKSWMVPCQYLIGIFMLILSYKVADIMGDESEGLYTFILLSFKKLEINCITALIHHFFPDSKAPNVLFLMLIFLPLNFLAATQDIAVDGWALTILSRKNVGYASTCNAVGQTAGYFLGNVVYLTLDSADFANRFFRTEPKPYGLVSLSGRCLWLNILVGSWRALIASSINVLESQAQLGLFGKGRLWRINLYHYHHQG
ncbi:unnamed protein product [Enterobius vermicularis]|uniref:Acetyl-coenzyme A transporter 1 n=1 Tax=Enterobius vermicularis TaxID=51028 RepID=A0A0N4UTB3_ENTVE|nr:unnamed protein product [Enterobius vermicularis]